MLTLFIEDNDLIAVGMINKKLGYQRIRHDCYMRLRKRLSDRPESGSRHDGITDPVGCSHQDALCILTGEVFQIMCTAL